MTDDRAEPIDAEPGWAEADPQADAGRAKSRSWLPRGIHGGRGRGPRKVRRPRGASREDVVVYPPVQNATGVVIRVANRVGKSPVREGFWCRVGGWDTMRQRLEEVSWGGTLLVMDTER